jgi:predicted DCC family thiol-disulfide oxidoreductase YuxK
MKEHPIILFDGFCNLCNGAIQFIIERDKNQHFRFASLQSKTGREYQKKAGLSIDKIDTVLLVENGEIYQKSTAGLRVARNLDGLWPVMFIFILIPPFIRNAVYDLIARNRYKWFGKKDSCWMPTPDLKALFLD